MLGLPADTLVAGLYGVILFFVALKQYFSARDAARTKSSTPDAVMTASSVGFGLGMKDAEQMERLIEQVKRIADALTDKHAHDVTAKLETLADNVDRLLATRRRGESDVLGQRTSSGRGRGRQPE